MKTNPEPDTLRGAWYYVYGKGSHMNIAGKILIGVPMFPFVVIFLATYFLAEFLFTKKEQQ